MKVSTHELKVNLKMLTFHYFTDNMSNDMHYNHKRVKC